jgi:hypothetical protein
MKAPGYRKYIKPRTKFLRIRTDRRPPRRVRLKAADWQAPKTITIQKTQFQTEMGDPWLVVFLRIFALYPTSWWTQGQVKKAGQSVMIGRLFNGMWQQAVSKELIRRGKNPEFDDTKHPQAGNPLWLFKITPKGLWLVAMFE